MRVLVTGADGFIARNFIVRIAELGDHHVVRFTRSNRSADLVRFCADVDAVAHLAGVNRPSDPAEFASGNAVLTEQLCGVLRESGGRIPLLLSSSTQAANDNPYGESKRKAERYVEAYAAATGSPVFIYRLPNVFGKWCRPNYNSVVATFCNNVSQGLPIQVNDPAALLTLVHVDDVVNDFCDALLRAEGHEGLRQVKPTYRSTVGALAKIIEAFKNSRETLVTEPVGGGLVRALYSTYMSYLRPDQFAYPVPHYEDPRGVFVEMLKTRDSGQFSFFTAYPGVTRGGHYHHSKTEKFLVIRGDARFRFRHIITGEKHELLTSAKTPMIVETIPGWAHDITNVGKDDMIVMLWANEIFDRTRPDTVACAVWT
jgi:UDP-2-acetamido-2,6-beta-L-arabino-hexul-4-ose reductase